MVGMKNWKGFGVKMMISSVRYVGKNESVLHVLWECPVYVTN